MSTARCKSGGTIAFMAALCSVPLNVAHAQAPTSFVTTFRTDTIAVEQFVRSGNTLTGDYVTRPGGTTVNHYVLRFGADGAPQKLEITQRKADGSEIPGAPKFVNMTIGATEAVVTIQRDTLITRRFAVPNAYPLLGSSIGLLEVAFTMLRTRQADSVSFPGLPVDTRQVVAPIQVAFFGADSARFWTETGPLFIGVDKAGHLSGLSGRATNAPVEIRRVTNLDLQKLLVQFAAADGRD